MDIALRCDLVTLILFQVLQLASGIILSKSFNLFMAQFAHL